MKRVLIIVLFLCVPVMTFAADPFKNIVRAIEQQYGVRHTGIPWFVRAIMKPALWGSGVSGLKLAEFEHCSFRGEGSQGRLARVIEQTVGPEWQQIVRVRSRQDGETTYIYVRPLGPKFTVLVVAIESNEASVVQLNLKPKQLEKWMNDQDVMTRNEHRRHRTELASSPSEGVLISSNTPGGYGILVP